MNKSLSGSLKNPPFQGKSAPVAGVEPVLTNELGGGALGQSVCVLNPTSEQRKAKRRATQAKFLRENRDRVNAARRSRYTSTKDVLNQKKRAWYAANLERGRSYMLKSSRTEAGKANRKAYRLAHRTEHKVLKRAWRKKNAAKENARNKSWCIRNRAHRAAYVKATRDSDPSFKIKDNLRRRLRRAVKSAKSRSSSSLVGCDQRFLKIYLESLFLPGMSWSNYGSEWDIDHIRPCSKFNFLDPEQQKVCFHFSNLQPLWKSENRAKSNHCIAVQYMLV